MEGIFIHGVELLHLFPLIVADPQEQLKWEVGGLQWEEGNQHMYPSIHGNPL